MNRRPREEPYDLDRTDTLPMPVLDADDTGTLAMPHLPEMEPSRVAEDLLSATDSFSAAALATPIAAIAVSVPDLAESLRERELRLAEAGRREQELAAQLAQAIERCAGLQTQLEQTAQRCAELERECAALREAAPPSHVPSAAVAAPQGLLDEIAALRRTNGLLHESISSLHGRLGVYEAMLAEAEEALRSVATAPAPLPVDWPARYAELETMLESERAAAASRLEEQAARLAALQAQVDAAPAGAAPRSPPAREAGAPMRVLVRVDNGTESVHPLGRHTTIGRTPDNDIQIDTTFVSRRHAMLLSSAGECIVEDLNSTNGLLVNGRRAGRQILQHGDTLTFGKTHFRYETRA